MTSLGFSSRALDPRVAEIGRQATAWKAAGNWDKAIECLRRLKNEFNVVTTRLPLFLCQAGNFDEGMHEFLWLIETAAQRTGRDMWDRPWPEFRARSFLAIERAHIYDKMRVACTRAKRPDLAAMYKDRSAEFRAEADRLAPLVDQERQAELSSKINRPYR